jgi:hypothetical protein
MSTIRQIKQLLFRAWGPITSWRTFVTATLGCFVAGMLLLYGLILWFDPYGIITPLAQSVLQYGNQRTLYPQIVRSGRYDSYIIGTSTSRLIDPRALNGPFGARFANLAMNSMLVWEQKTMLEMILHKNATPKAIIIGLDGVWCAADADMNRVLKEGFPDWLYDDNRWNDFVHLLNDPTLRIVARQILYRFGLVAANLRDDGFGVFVPPETQYNLARVELELWHGAPRRMPARPADLTATERQAMLFPALQWLDSLLAQMPSATLKIMAFVPVHVSAQPQTPTDAAREDECKRRIVKIARLRGTVLIDWRFPSILTSADNNYWDPLHFRVPVAERITHDLIGAAIEKQPSNDGTYQILVQ